MLEKTPPQTPSGMVDPSVTPQPRQIGVGTAKISARAKRYVMEVLDNERLSYGPFSRKFETMFASAHAVRYALLCNSGTSALECAVAALKEIDGWQDGDELIVPAVTFVASSNVVIMNGMKPVFVDVDSKTYNIDPTKIEAAITPRTRGIMPVHLFGQPCDMDPIMASAKRHGLRVIEDSCETMFASYRNRPVGSFGDVSCFSTYVAHLLITGVGGLACTSDDRIATIIKSLYNHGRDNIYISIDDSKGKSVAELREVVGRRFKFERLGFSYRATEMEAALGVAQIEEWNDIVGVRRKAAKQLTEFLSPLEDVIQLPWSPRHVDHSFMMYPIVVRDIERGKTNFVNFLEERGVETREMLPLINQPFYVKLFGDLEPQFPVARWINRCGFYVGCHQGMTEADIAYTARAVGEFFGRKVGV
jgi:dTDP-4-amino-4,6-dideoxygalactose transaminase